MKKSTPAAEVKAPARDPRFPDYSKVIPTAFDGDREVQDSQQGGAR